MMPMMLKFDSYTLFEVVIMLIIAYVKSFKQLKATPRLKIKQARS